MLNFDLFFNRAKIQELETKLEQYHDEIVVKVAEILQARQRILENYDKISALDETTEDNKYVLELLVKTNKARSPNLALDEPPCGKTNNVVFEQVRHKLICTVTEAG